MRLSKKMSRSIFGVSNKNIFRFKNISEDLTTLPYFPPNLMNLITIKNQCLPCESKITQRLEKQLRGIPGDFLQLVTHICRPFNGERYVPVRAARLKIFPANNRLSVNA